MKKGFLASTNFYSCISHKDNLIDLYTEALNDVYKSISQFERGEKNVDDFLEGPVCHDGFYRLN